MRKRISCLLLLVLLGGCANPLPAQPQQPLVQHSGNYETTAVITCKDLSATATLSQQFPGSCAVAFTAPASLKDMAFVFRRDAVDISYKGLSFHLDPGSVPSGAVAEIMVTAINKAMRDDGIAMAVDDRGIQLSGTLDAGAFTLRLDKETGNLLKLSVPGEELEIQFENFRFLD